ncbi:tumor necrosis factor receptor superfamily member 9a isoform X2 [Paramormyrops kingsleyae]|uniref:tumor necrosis factor receptor superfamily member 9a isoform X2 n=1 Tax=Paramormyrops kingsleyae TaxID=1676925 RepID=UPI000CD63139|nr:tumor necrosis factor receptor superfamily member 9-like isoform X2 [Paramormyrops kingsleyae]
MGSGGVAIEDVIRFVAKAVGAVMLHTVTITLVLAAVCTLSNSSCDRWTFAENSSDVCCEICSEGHYLVKQCGPDPQKLCDPCPTRKYLNKTNSSCVPCRTCSDPQQVVMHRCTTSSDTVCGCEKGHHCANSECSKCAPCGEGEELLQDGSCHKCPYGKFKNESLSSCRPWSNSCPQQGCWIMVNGTAVSDSICLACPKGIQCHPVPPKSMMIIIIVAVVFFGLGLLPSCFLIGKLHMYKQEEKPPGSENEPQTLIFRLGQPEQEQGGSMGSVSSDDSEKSLLSV